MTKCPVCKQPAELRINLKLFCSYDCAAQWGKAQTDKAKAKRQLEQRRADRVKKESFKRRSEWIASLQTVFNKYIRLRDAGLNCISCDRPEWEIDASTPINRTGGLWDAGHYLSRGAYPELRFEESNCHKQCKSCNAGSGKFSAKGRTVTQRYRVNLIEKIGLEKVEWLEGPQEPLKLTIEQIQQMIADYKLKIKEMA